MDSFSATRILPRCLPPVSSHCTGNAADNGEPANECGVGVLGGGNCIRNSTTKMSAALKKYGAAAGKEIVYYIDHGNPTSPQRLFNPQQRFVSAREEAQSDVAKLAVLPDQLGWTWAAEVINSPPSTTCSSTPYGITAHLAPQVCHMMKTTFDTNDSWESMLNNLHSTINLPSYQRAGYRQLSPALPCSLLPLPLARTKLKESIICASRVMIADRRMGYSHCVCAAGISICRTC